MVRACVLGIAALAALAPTGARAQECARDFAAAASTLEMIELSTPVGAAAAAVRDEQKAALTQIGALLKEARGFLTQAQQYGCLVPTGRDHERAIAAALAQVALAFVLGADQLFLEAGMEHRH